MFTVHTNAAAVERTIERLNHEIKWSMPALWRRAGPALVNDVRERIQTQDKGRWEAVSKWVRAKKTVLRPLQGAENFVKWKFSGRGMVVYGDMPSDWTLTQHHEGFTNKENNVKDGRVEINVINPGPLGLSRPGKFSWVPKGEPAQTPARKIWPLPAEARAIVLPLASRWLESIVNRVASEMPK